MESEELELQAIDAHPWALNAWEQRGMTEGPHM